MPAGSVAPTSMSTASRRLRVGGLMGVALVAVLAAAVLVQTHMARLLNLTTQYQDDYLQVNLGQIESEYLRLRSLWHDSLHGGLFDRDALQLRYDIFLSRVDLLKLDTAARLTSTGADAEQTITQLRRFVADADVYLGAEPVAALDETALRQLLPALDALDAPLHSYALDVAHHVTTQVATRTQEVELYNRYAITLTAMLCVIALVFALISISQMSRLDQRRRDLEDLADSLRDARLAAESASLAKSAFLANMSHEIRTPFQGLLGMLALLRETGLETRQANYLRTATESADHLLTLLNDILDLSKLESGSMRIDRAAVDLHALVGDIDALMRPQATARKLSLRVEIAADVPTRVMGDATRLRQILFNLLSNAIKFTDTGAVTLRVRRGSGTLLLVVADTGIGIDANTLPRLFQRFSQGDPSASRRHGGTGLGLEISRNLARLMQGDIAVESKPGAGSTFTVTLPFDEAVDPPG